MESLQIPGPTLYVWLFSSAIRLLLLLSSANGFTTVSNLQAPKFLVRGQTAVFHCRLTNPESMTDIRTIKWFFNHQEFYRCFVSSNRIQTFGPVPFDVDTGASECSKVALKILTFNATGEYTCQTMESNNYQLSSSSRKLQVVDLPDKQPAIENIKEEYMVGERLGLKCVSRAARPAVKLQWTINGYPPGINGDSLAKSVITEDAYGTFSTYSNLNYTIPSHLAGETMSVKCKAYMSEAEYEEATEIVLTVAEYDGAKSQPIVSSSGFLSFDFFKVALVMFAGLFTILSQSRQSIVFLCLIFTVCIFFVCFVHYKT